MFAVVEFAGPRGESCQEISVVPLIWLCKNDTKCYWPRKTDKPFNEFVKSETPYKKSWPTYKVFKIHSKTENYEHADSTLTKLLDSAAEAAALSNTSTISLVQKDLSDNDESSDKSSDESSHNTPSPKRMQISDIYRKKSQTLPQKQISEKVQPELEFENPGSSSSSLATTITMTRSDVSSSVSSEFEKTILNELSKISANVEQHSIILNELLRANRDQAPMPPPKNIPQFPLKTLEEFNHFENTLKSDQGMSTYLMRRLSAVGGSGLESLTRRILQYLLSNELAQQFNWKGRDKISFEKTTLMTIIYDAAKRNFPSDEKNDFKIAETVKHWLKYAKSRMEKSSKAKKTQN